MGSLELVSRHPSARWLVVAVPALALGWLVGAAGGTLAPLRYEGTIEGTVGLVNDAGSKLCVEPDGGGRQRCGVVYRPPGASPPRLRDRVSVIVGTLRTAAGLETEIFLILEAAE